MTITGGNATTSSLFSDTGSFTNLFGSLLDIGNGALTVNGSGNVGIGTTAPHGKLEVAGYVTISDPTTPELHYGYSGWSSGRGWWSSGIDQAATVPMRDFVVAEKGLSFSVTDASLTQTSSTLTSVNANFTSAAVGYTVVGTGIPANTTILSVTDSSHAVMSAAATQSGTNVSVAFSKVGQNVNDLEYWSHNGFGDATLGIGLAQPDSTYRAQIRAGTLNLNQGTLKLKIVPGQIGDLLSADTIIMPNAFRLTSDGAMQVQTSTTTAPAFLVENNGGTPFFSVYNGNIGIGSSSPMYPLYILTSSTANQTANVNADNFVIEQGTGNAGITILSGTTGQGNIYFGDSGNVARGALQYDHSTDSLNLRTNGTQRLVIDTNGKVSVGTTTPTGIFTVGGDSTFSFPTPGNSYGQIYLVPTSGTNGNSSAITFGANNSGSVSNISVAGIYVQSSSAFGSKMYFGTTNSFGTGSQVRMMIDHLGNVGIGTTNPSQQLTVSGSVGFPGIGNGAGTAYVCQTLATGVISTSTTACNPSSIRFKDNVQDLSAAEGLTAVRKLRPVSYTYKPELLIPGNQIGFIAEEVDPIIPEVVGHDASGTPSNIDYAKLAPVLVKAIQELDAKVNATSTQTITDNSGLLDNLAFIGGSVVQGVLHLSEAFIDKLHTKTISTQGIEMQDSATGQWYCVRITNGDWDKQPGTCDALSSNQNSSSGPNLEVVDSSSTPDTASSTTP